MTPTPTRVLSWETVHRDSKALADKLKALPPFRGIVAVSRGGLVPAAIVACELDILLVDTVCVSSYDGQTPHPPEILNMLGIEDSKDLLVIDDLVDRGATVGLIRKLLPHAHYAVVYAKPEGRSEADTFAIEVDQDHWLVFPWETP